MLNDLHYVGSIEVFRLLMSSCFQRLIYTMYSLLCAHVLRRFVSHPMKFSRGRRIPLYKITYNYAPLCWAANSRARSKTFLFFVLFLALTTAACRRKKSETPSPRDRLTWFFSLLTPCGSPKHIHTVPSWAFRWCRIRELVAENSCPQWHLTRVEPTKHTSRWAVCVCAYFHAVLWVHPILLAEIVALVDSGTVCLRHTSSHNVIRTN